MPEPTAAELAREAEQEAAVFAQAVNVERLLNMLRSMDPDRDNLADNEEIQVRVVIPSRTQVLSPLSGTVPFLHDSQAQDRQAH